MGYLRNLLYFSIFTLVIAGCGGGKASLSDNSSSSTGTNTTQSNSSANSNVTGNITLKWTAPKTLADTTPVSLSDISGYKLYYGTSPTYTPNIINISDSTATQYTVSLPSGTYYFVICAVDSNGNPGLMSVVIQKTI